MQAKLRVWQLGPDRRYAEPQMFLLPIGRYEIGRDTACHIQLRELEVSRRHCLLLVREEGVSVSDLNSRHGTYLEGQRVTSERRLRHGDVLFIGHSRIEVYISIFDCYDTSPGPEDSDDPPRETIVVGS
jgi:pSer/pThr/pTyr-binding forkhead associated (FHA) protein